MGWDIDSIRDALKKRFPALFVCLAGAGLLLQLAADVSQILGLLWAARLLIFLVTGALLAGLFIWLRKIPSEKQQRAFRAISSGALFAWASLLLSGSVAPLIGGPAFIPAGAMPVLALMGLPLALIFLLVRIRSWGGPASDSRKLDWFIAAALVTVIVLVSREQFVEFPRSVRTADIFPATRNAPPPDQATGISVAVLRFSNLSGDTGQEFFSDGMTEEITAALAKIPAMRVVGRTSAFQVGDKKDLREIGKALNATYLIEGSVRKDGNQVRIIARLIDARDGKQLWTQPYDEELNGIFAVQEHIAESIAGSLQVPLGLKEPGLLVPNRTSDPIAYQEYLQAKRLVRTRGAPEPNGPLTQATRLLENSVRRDPDYAPAHALLAQADILLASYTSGFSLGADATRQNIVKDLLAKAETAAKEALRLDEKSVDGYAAIATVQFCRGDMLEAEESFIRARSIDPNNTDVLHFYSLLLGNVGHLNEALALRQQLRVLDPLVVVFNIYNASFFWVAGQDAAALEIFRSLPADNPLVARQISLLYASEGKYREALEAFRRASPILGAKLIEMTGQLLTKRSLPNNPDLVSANIFYAFSNTPYYALASFQANLKANFLAAWEGPQFWHPSFAPVRRTNLFKDLMREAHFVEFWRTRGWPDQGCHPVGANDFSCG